MSAIDLTKPLQWNPDGKQWIDVTWHREMPDGALVIEYGFDVWAMTRHPKDCAKLRNKPEPRVRPYTFEEAKRFVGKPVVHKAQAFSNVCLLVVSAWVCNDSGDVMFSLSRSDTPHLGDWMLKNYTHPDGSPFGVVENE